MIDWTWSTYKIKRSKNGTKFFRLHIKKIELLLTKMKDWEAAEAVENDQVILAKNIFAGLDQVPKKKHEKQLK